VKHARSGGFTVALAALVCLLFVARLVDVALGPLVASAPAPTVPAEVTLRDGRLFATVRDETGALLEGASVRVFSVRERRAYFAGEGATDAQGVAEVGALPRGPAWVLAYAAGRARVSSELLFSGGAEALSLVLGPASALDVVVVDEGDRPVLGARVTLRGDDALPFAGRTNADGTTRLDRLGPPPYEVTVRAPGFDPVVREVAAAVPLRVRLVALGALEVRVVGVDREPVPGATVLVAGSGIWPAQSTEADAAGRARIGGLRAGVYDLRAKWNDQVSRTELAVPLARGETKEVTLALAPGRHVAITVVDGPEEDARPVVAADVVAVEGGLSPFPQQGRTDDEGRVVLGPFAPETLTLSARAEGFVARSGVRVAVDGTEARLELVRGGALVGDVVDDRGYPVDGATIEVIGVDDEGLPIDESALLTDLTTAHFALGLAGPRPLLPVGELGVMPGPIPDLPRDEPFGAVASVHPMGPEPWVTRRDGTFRVAPVPPGRLQALVRHPSYVEGASEVVTLRPGGEATVHVVLREGGSLEGRVVDADGRPAGGARVELAALRGTLVRVTYTADDGAFAFASVPDEVMLAVARPESPGDPVVRLVVAIAPGERKEIEVMLPAARPTMRVRVADDRGYPLGRAEVRALALAPADPLRVTAFTDDDGDALVADAVGLALRLTVTLPGKAALIQDFDAAPEAVEVTLAPSVTARGVITANGGRERVEGASVVAYTRTGPRHAVTDVDGAFELKDLAPGRVRLAIEHDEHAPRDVVERVGADPERPTDFGEIDLLAAGEVSGLVLDAEGEPVAGARVALGVPPAYLPLGPLPSGVVLTDRQGRFVLGGLPEGDVMLGAYATELGRGYADAVPVRAGRTTTEVEIALSGAASSRQPEGAGSVAVTLGETSEREVVVLAVPPASEAAFAGVEPEDVLVAVDDAPVRGLEGARQRLSGPLAEDVLLTLRREDRPGETLVWKARVRRERVRR